MSQHAPGTPPIAARTESATDHERRVLETRARALARPVRERAERGDDVVIFGVAGETCALALDRLVHVMPLRELAMLPGADAPVVGITAFRGALIPVLDLAHLLGATSSTHASGGSLLLLGESDAPVALLADALHGLATLPRSAIADTAAAKHRFVRGITPDAVLVLDADLLIRSLFEEEP